MKNTAELIGFYGSDKIIACSAWTSTSRNLTKEKEERIPQMIKRLWSEGHETPFEKGIVHFLVNTDIATHIHLLKHRISSMNGESARYKELREDKYLIPEDWKNIPVDKKHWNMNYIGQQAAANFESYDWEQCLADYTILGNKLYHKALEDLTPVLGRKRAKESARFFKTYNSQIEGDISFNMRSFANFLKLRNSEHAQKEIRELAKEMLSLIQNIENKPFKYTLEAWGYGEST